jgi:hypothetical protein
MAISLFCHWIFTSKIATYTATEIDTSKTATAIIVYNRAVVVVVRGGTSFVT